MPGRRQLANAIRALSMDAVQKANSGHPGMPMGMADIAEVLWNDFLQHNPNNPGWINRDRFMLSNGHGSMLLYSLLHLTGYDMSINDLKNFRQLHSKTPGHPEYGCAPGIETTTGPLGQGLANAVGMSLAEKTLARQFNRDEFNVIDHFTYVFIGDGCLMEGISHEACSLAGTLKLGKLIAFYDDNGISIDGKVAGWFTDDTTKRFEAYHWHVISNVDGHDPEAIKQAILAARDEKNKPTIICCKTEIGHGAPNLAGSHKAHGSPLGDEEINATRENIGWKYPPFEVPAEIYNAFDARKKGEEADHAWGKQFSCYEDKYPELAKELLRRIRGQLPEKLKGDMRKYLKQLLAKPENISTRKASGNCLEVLGPIMPELMGGSADLTGSNNTWWSGSKVICGNESSGNYIYYGVREFAMFAMMNGLALHGGFIPYGGTFLIFMDYGRNAMRLCAMMKQRVIFILSHDSIGLGEDGPTHQPIEQASILRLTPNMSVWRPADSVETAVAWHAALQRQQGPTSLLLTRQLVPPLPHKNTDNIQRGGYILRDSDGMPEVIIIATGSEVSLALAAAEELAQVGRRIRVVSMPSTTTFDQQDEKYRHQVLPPNIINRVAVEAATKDFWYKYVGLNGKIIGMNTFGESAPYKEIYQVFGITVEKIVEQVEKLIGTNMSGVVHEIT